MKFLSLKTLRENAFHSLLRFPLPLVTAFIGTAIAVRMVEKGDTIGAPLIQLLFACFIGLPCLLGCNLFAERLSSKMQRWLVTALGLVFVIAYGVFFAPDDFSDNSKQWLIFFVLNICMHLWVAIAPYISKNEPVGFWRFNEELFTRFVLTVIFSGVLYGGLCLSLLSVNELFNLSIEEDNYGKLFLIVAGVFNTWFFLAGIPRYYEQINVEKVFSKGLKVFTQYILIPLAILYMFILYAYAGKIVLQWSLPKGWVSMLIMCYSLVGILAILLVYPLRDMAENAWVRLFARFFFIAILPLVVLLFVAIGIRIDEYGVTELRYYLVVLGSWLAVISLYYTFSKKKHIRLIPVSLLIVGLLSLFGPWSVFSISYHSQYNRLEKIFVKYEMVKNGQPLVKPKSMISNKDENEVVSIINYMVENGYAKNLTDLYQSDISVIMDTVNAQYSKEWKKKAHLKDTLRSMAYMTGNTTQAYSEYEFYGMKEGNKTYNATGYSQVIKINYGYYQDSYREQFTLQDSTVVSMYLAKEDNAFVYKVKGKEVARIELTDFLKALRKQDNSYDIPISVMTLESKGEMKMKMIVTQWSIHVRDVSISEVNNIEAYLFFE